MIYAADDVGFVIILLFRYMIGIFQPASSGSFTFVEVNPVYILCYLSMLLLHYVYLEL